MFSFTLDILNVTLVLMIDNSNFYRTLTVSYLSSLYSFVYFLSITAFFFDLI